MVNNLSSFFLGVDDPVRPHHQNCITHPTSQSHLCHLVKKTDGTAYVCPRHSQQPQHHTAPNAFATYHKQELLAKVEALHFVYASADELVYNGNFDDYTSGDDTSDDDTSRYDTSDDEDDMSRLGELCDTRRYEDVPECTKRVAGSSPLTSLKRATVGRWMEDESWTMGNVAQWIGTLRNDISAAAACEAFKERLSSTIPQIGPRLICRSARQGILYYYPRTAGKIQVNILHDPLYDNFGSNLVVGAFNIVHIPPESPISSMHVFVHAYVDIVWELHTTMEAWSRSHSAAIAGRTFVRFVLSRDIGDPGIEDDLMVDISQCFGVELASLPSLPTDFQVSWDICWAEEEGDCPACQPDTCHPAYKTDSFCNHLSRQMYDQRQTA